MIKVSMKSFFSASVRRYLTAIVILFSTFAPAFAQRQMEKLGRGVVVLHSATSQAYVGWRLLATDPTDVGFNLYRSTAGGAGVKLNASVLTNTTDFLDTTANFTVSNSWYVVPVTNGVEGSPAAPAGLAANAPVRQYISWPLRPVTNGAAPPYDVKFCWVGDLDGDGEYDYLVDRFPRRWHQPVSSGLQTRRHVSLADGHGLQQHQPIQHRAGRVGHQHRRQGQCDGL